MSTIAFKTSFQELYAKSEAERRHRYHQMETNKEATTYAEILKQNKYDQEVIATGPRNGSPKTQHGVSAELKNTAEMNNVEVRTARTEGRAINLVVKSEETNGPHDMVRVISGEDRVEYIQSKYCKDPVRTLDSCIQHMETYPEWYIDNPDGKYNIPKEQYELIIAVKEGRVPEGTPEGLVKAIEKRIEKFEAVKGDSVENIIPGVSYEDAQCENTERVNKERNEKIEKTHKEKEIEIESKFSPSFKTSLKVGLEAAAVTGITSIVFGIGKSIVDGKDVLSEDYIKDELMDEAIKAGKAATVACVVATATHYAETVLRHSGACLLAVGKLACAIIPLIEAHDAGEITTAELKAGIYSVMLGLFTNAIVGIGIGMAASAIVAAVIGTSVTLPALVLGTLGALVGIGLGAILDKAYNYIGAVINADVIEQQARHVQLIDDMKALIEQKEEEIRIVYVEALAAHECSFNESLPINCRLKAMSDVSARYDNRHVKTEYSFDNLIDELFG